MSDTKDLTLADFMLATILIWQYFELGILLDGGLCSLSAASY